MKTDVAGLDLSKSYGYNARNKAYLNQPHANSRVYRNSFLAKGLKAYNALPLKIREARSISTFSLQSKVNTTILITNPNLLAPNFILAHLVNNSTIYEAHVALVYIKHPR